MSLLPLCLWRLVPETCVRAPLQAYVKVFMKEMHANFPNMIIQFEDFHTTLAFPVLANNRDVYPCKSTSRRKKKVTHDTRADGWNFFLWLRLQRWYAAILGAREIY